MVFIYNFKTRFAAWLLDAIISRIFKRDIRQRLAGLKHHAEETDILERMRSPERETAGCG